MLLQRKWLVVKMNDTWSTFNGQIIFSKLINLRQMILRNFFIIGINIVVCFVLLPRRGGKEEGK